MLCEQFFKEELETIETESGTTISSSSHLLINEEQLSLINAEQSSTPSIVMEETNNLDNVRTLY